LARLVLLDSSVFIALFHPEDKHHQVAKELEKNGVRFIASTLSITEVMPRAIKNSIAPLISGALDLLVDEFVDITSEVAHLAAEFRAHKGLKTPDAIIAATAQIHKAELWTFDAKLAKVTPGARWLA
jgi:predicted nucleic acid-binding protein